MSRQNNSPSLTVRAEIGKQFVPDLRRQLRRLFSVDRLLGARLLSRARSKRYLTEVSIALVDDKQMSDLHLRFMNIAGPTDVLTFPIDINNSGGVTGEVVICVPEGRRRSKELGIPIGVELLLYALHGILHLIGLDDKTEVDYQHMHRIEDDILTLLGMGKVFHRQAKSRPKRAGRNIARGDR